MTKKIFLLTLFVLVLISFASAQTTKIQGSPEPTSTPSDPPPGDIQLFDGYTHTQKRGIDSRVGEISKPGGLVINYDIGQMAGLDAGRCGRLYECQWYKGQRINGREVWISLAKDGLIVATFPKEYANFFARTKSSEDIADFLTMVLTYRVKEPVPTDKTLDK